MSVTKLNERKLNEAFALSVETSPDFKDWLLLRTSFGKVQTKVVLARGDNPWSRSKIDGIESETDILIVFERESDGSRFALHIENKQPSDHFRIGQAARYKIRAAEWANIEKWGCYSDFVTVILASAAFVAKHSEDCSMFDHNLTYEAVSEFVPEFRVL